MMIDGVSFFSLFFFSFFFSFLPPFILFSSFLFLFWEPGVRFVIGIVIFVDILVSEGCARRKKKLWLWEGEKCDLHTLHVSTTCKSWGFNNIQYIFSHLLTYSYFSGGQTVLLYV